VFDYTQNSDFSVEAITNAGAYTIRILRLNERPELRNIKSVRQKIQLEYKSKIELLYRLLARAEASNDAQTIPELKVALEAIKSTVIPEYERFVSTDPFILSAVPSSCDVNAIFGLFLKPT